MSQQILNLVEKPNLREEKFVFEIGDTVDVHCRILEGEKERIQIFSGIVIARSGSGTREMFTVRRIVQGEGVERKFPFHSPRIAKIVVQRAGVTPARKTLLPPRPRRQGGPLEGAPRRSGEARRARVEGKQEVRKGIGN